MSWEADYKDIIIVVTSAAAAVIIIRFLKTNYDFPGLREKVMAVLCLNSFPDKQRERWLNKHI